VQTWLPFTVEVRLNGREWLARQMDHQAGLAYVQRDNAFTDLGDAAAAQALLARCAPRQLAQAAAGVARPLSKMSHARSRRGSCASRRR